MVDGRSARSDKGARRSARRALHRRSWIGPGGQRLLSMARGEPHRAWHAVARIDGRLGGRAWSFVAGDVAGVYDMEVWPALQRRGLGRALLRTVCDAAREAGASR